MYLESISLSNFRNYSAFELRPASEGLTLLEGVNGSGKTNLLEAIYYAATLRSFRGAPVQAIINSAAPQAVLRAMANRDGRNLLVEIELNKQGRNKLRLNRQPLRRTEELSSTLPVVVFSPDDIEVVKGGPQARRDFLDDLLSSLHTRFALMRTEMDRALRQRNALLKSANGSLRAGMASTLDVWDAKLAEVGEQLRASRTELVSFLGPQVSRAYELLSGTPGSLDGGVPLRYQTSWEGALSSALLQARADDVRRGITTVGPQRDELELTIGGLMARAQASQGEQRSLALALRLASHWVLTAKQGTSPLLLLDDIFSELDPLRSGALASSLPQCQVLLTAASQVPAGLPVACTFRVTRGTVQPV